MAILLPDIPATTTWIPTINNAIPMRMPTRAAPITGDTSIIIDSIISNIPTPMLNPLAFPYPLHREQSLRYHQTVMQMLLEIPRILLVEIFRFRNTIVE